MKTKQMPTLDQLCDQLSIKQNAFDKFRAACEEITQAMHNADSALSADLSDLREEGAPESEIRQLHAVCVEFKRMAEMAGRL